MKILFTADWHIKLGQKNVPVSWALNRYQEFFNDIYELEKDIDIHIIGGDLFDRLPSLEELELFFSFIEKVQVPTYIYDGNHEAAKKNETFLNKLQNVSSRINRHARIITDIFEDPDYGFQILPYGYLHSKGVFDMLNSGIPLFTHVRGEIPPHVTPEVPLENFDKFPVVFAGDLHSHSNTQRNIVYPGSPMTVEFHRNKVSTGYIIIETDDWSWEWGEFDLPQLIRKKVSHKSEMVKTERDHTIYELEGDLQDLAAVENSELLDKKVVRRSTDAALILDDGLTIEEELT